MNPLTNIERIALEIGAGLLIVWATVTYLEHRGAAACKQADTVAAAKQEGHEEAKAASDTRTINQEAKTYAQTLAAPDPIDSPHVSLCHYTPSAVPSAPTPGSSPHESAPSRAADPVNPPTDVGPPLVKVGVDADAQVKGLQDYIQRVCLVR